MITTKDNNALLNCDTASYVFSVMGYGGKILPFNSEKVKDDIKSHEITVLHASPFSIYKCLCAIVTRGSELCHTHT